MAVRKIVKRPPKQRKITAPQFKNLVAKLKAEGFTPNMARRHLANGLYVNLQSISRGVPRETIERAFRFIAFQKEHDREVAQRAHERWGI